MSIVIVSNSISTLGYEWKCVDEVILADQRELQVTCLWARKGPGHLRYGTDTQVTESITGEII